MVWLNPGRMNSGIYCPPKQCICLGGFVCLFSGECKDQSSLVLLTTGWITVIFLSWPRPFCLCVCVFLGSPLDLAALAINWFSHLASAFWGMTATACRFCLLDPDPATAWERTERPPVCAEKDVFFYAAVLKELQIEQGFGDNMLHHPSWSAHTCSRSHANSWGSKEAQHEFCECGEGIVDRQHWKRREKAGWQKEGGVEWEELLSENKRRMIYKMAFKDVINQHRLSFAERREIKPVTEKMRCVQWTEIMTERSLVW